MSSCNINEKDIFDILGISGREDSYTDLIYSIFEISEGFRKKLLKKFFNGNEDIDNFEMKIRSCYFTPEGSRKKIIPDIILHNNNEIVIIEVKIFSGEGENQLKRYDEGLNTIIEQLKLDAAMNVNKYFLTLDKYEDNKLGGGFKSLTWYEFIDLIPDKTNSDIINKCIKDLKERVNEYDSYCRNEVDIKDIYNWHHFVSYEKILKQIFKKEMIGEKYEWDIWEGWENGENCYAATIQVYCDKSWLSDENTKININDEEDKVINKDIISVKNNYDIHYEIKIIDNKDNKDKRRIEFRIDYHTNPYFTNKDIKGYELLSLDEGRKNIIKEFNEQYKNESNKLNKPQGKALYVYKDMVDIENNCTVGDFKNIIFDFINKNVNKVNNLLNIIKNQ